MGVGGLVRMAHHSWGSTLRTTRKFQRTTSRRTDGLTLAIHDRLEIVKTASRRLKEKGVRRGEIWCPTLGGTPTFIGLYGALASYCLIVLLSYYPIVLLSYYLIFQFFNYPIVHYLIVLYSTLYLIR